MFFLLSILIFLEFVYSGDLIPLSAYSLNYKSVVDISFGKIDKQLLIQDTQLEQINIESSLKYLSYVNKNYRFNYRSEFFKCCFVMKPYNTIWYKIGMLFLKGNVCELSDTKELYSNEYGFGFDMGIYVSVFPYTIVNSPIFLRVGSTTLFNNFDILKDKEIFDIEKVNIDFNMTESYFGFFSSKSLKKIIELDYGVNLVYRTNYLLDKETYIKKNGNEWLINFVCGPRFYLSEKESISCNVSYFYSSEISFYTTLSIAF